MRATTRIGVMSELAFTEDQVARLAGLSPWRVRHWVRSGVLDVQYSNSPGRVRLYAFVDLIAFRILAQLRKNLSLSALRDVGRYLSEFDAHPWSRLRLFQTESGDVLFEDADTGHRFSARKRQGQRVHEVCTFDLEQLSHDLRRDIREIRVRPTSDQGQIARHRRVLGNAPVLAGTRIPVDLVKRLAAKGYSTGKIVAEFPALSRKDVDAALAYPVPEKRARRKTA